MRSRGASEASEKGHRLALSDACLEGKRFGRSTRELVWAEGQARILRFRKLAHAGVGDAGEAGRRSDGLHGI